MVVEHQGGFAMRIKHKAQSTIEMTFVMIAICLLAFGMVRIFRWIGMDLGERRWTQENSLTTGNDVIQQLNPDFYRTKRMNSAVKY